MGLWGRGLYTLSSLEDEGDTVPSLVLDIDRKSTEGRASAVLGNGVIVEVARLAPVKGFPVLADDDVLGLNGGDTAQHPDLLVTNVLRRERYRTLHTDDGENLQQIYNLR